MTSISNFAVTRDSSPWPSYPDLAGKVAVVTGGSRGLGAAACRALAANEVKVAVNGRDGSAIDATVSEIGDAGGTAVAAPADCTNAAALAHVCNQVEQQLGPVDVLLAFAAAVASLSLSSRSPRTNGAPTSTVT